MADYLVSRKLQSSMRDLLLLYCWEQHAKHSEGKPVENPQAFTLLRVLGQPNTQLVLHSVSENKVIRNTFQTAEPQEGRLLVFDLDEDGFLMLSEKEMKEIMQRRGLFI